LGSQDVMAVQDDGAYECRTENERCCRESDQCKRGGEAVRHGANRTPRLVVLLLDITLLIVH